MDIYDYRRRTQGEPEGVVEQVTQRLKDDEAKRIAFFTVGGER